MQLLCVINCRFATLCYTFTNDRPLLGCRQTYTKYVIKIFSIVQFNMTGLWPYYRYIDFDYSEYLGPDYKKDMKEVKHISTIVCNH